jgi:hypothetical protein
VLKKSLGVSGSRGKRIEDVLRRDLLNLQVFRQSVFPKPLPKIACELLAIGQEPRFHALDHQVDLIVLGGVRTIPIVSGFQVLPRQRGDGVLAVYQEDGKLVRPKIA